MTSMPASHTDCIPTQIVTMIAYATSTRRVDRFDLEARMTTVRHNAALGRYELETPPGLAIAVYHQQGDRLVFIHTEVPSADERHGLGSQLMRGAPGRPHRPAFKTG